MLKKVRQFHASEEGTALLVFALTIFIVIGGVAFAIDVSRFFAAKSRLSIANEMAVVAAAQNFRFLSAAELSQLATEMVQANFHGADLLTYSDEAVAPPSVNLLTDSETGEVTLRTSAVIPTTLLRALNFLDPVTVASEITVVQQKPEAEITLVIEASEIFEAADRLAEVRSAAQDFIAALEAETIQEQGIKWAFVPFGNEIVNVAPHDDWVEAGSWPVNIPPTVPGTTEWVDDLAEDRWCAAPRLGFAGEDDTPPAIAPFPLVLTLNAEINTGTGLPHFTNTTMTDCREDRIRGLTDSVTISTALASMQGNGGTAYGRAMIWAERTLSPLWQGVWDGDAARPVAYDDEAVEKVAILVVGSDAENATEDSRLSSTCARMKQNDIALYVIDYLAPAGTSTRLEACATTAGHYFHVPDEPSLRSAFFAIAKFMTVVRFAG